MNEESLLLAERKDMIEVLTLNRPPMNLVNPALLSLLSRELDRIASERSIRAVILAASGKKAFCAGADMGDQTTFGDEASAKSFRELGRSVVAKIEDLPQPVLAAVDGYCAGGGTGLAWACDFIVATDRARFGARDAYLGMIPQWSIGMVRLAPWVGRKNATEILLMGEWFSGEKAMEYGLVNRVVPPEKLMETAMEMAAHLCSAAPLCLERLKRGIRKSIFDGFEAARRFEEESIEFLRKTWDAKEGIQAFMEKRKPEFKGE